MGIKLKNNTFTYLSFNIDTSQTEITVDDGTVFPELAAGDYFYCTLERGVREKTYEIIKVTAVDGNVLTCERAQDDSTAYPFTSSTLVEMRLNKAVFEESSISIEINTSLTGAGTELNPIGIADADDTLPYVNVDGVWTDLNSYIVSAHNDLSDIEQAATGITHGHISDQAQTIAGVKTFSSIPVGPGTDPTTDNELTRKAYADLKLAKASNLSDVASQQTALNNITAVSGATNEYVLTKDTSTGDAVFKEAPSGGGVWGSITGTLGDQTDLDNALDGKSDTGHNHNLADLTEKSYSSLTGTPTIPTIDDTAYNESTWDANTDGATKNAIRDQFEALASIYSPIGHDHDADYSAIGHDHDSDYSAIGHDHDADYSAIGHNHNLADLAEKSYASLTDKPTILELGELSTNAYRGDRGKTAYDHSQDGTIHLSSAQKTDLTDAGESAAHYHDTDRARANHTGSQVASTISDFDTEVSNNTDVASNTSHKTSDGTDHTYIDQDLRESASPSFAGLTVDGSRVYPITNYNGTNNKAKTIDVSDWDDCVQTGIWMGNNKTNACETGWVFCQVMRHADYADDSDYLVQVQWPFTGDGYEKMYMRCCAAGTWGSWKEISMDGHEHTASAVTDFDTEVSNNTDVAANTTHRGTVALHREIDDSGSAATDLWSADKIATEIAAGGGSATDSETAEAGEALSKGDVVQLIGGKAYQYKHLPAIGRGTQNEFSGSAFTLPTGATSLAINANLVAYLNNYSDVHRQYFTRYNGDEYEDWVLGYKTINTYAHRGTVRIGGNKVLSVATGTQSGYYGLYAYVAAVKELRVTLGIEYGTVLNHFSTVPGTATYGADAFTLAEDEVLVPYCMRITTGNWQLRLAKLDPSVDPIVVTQDVVLRSDLYVRSRPRIFWLGGDDYLITYVYDSSGSILGFKINTAKGSATVSETNETTLLSSYGTVSTMVQLSEKYLVILYKDPVSPYPTKAILIDTSGSTPSVAVTAQTLSTIPATSGITVGKLTSNSFIVMHGSPTGLTSRLSTVFVDATDGFEALTSTNQETDDFASVGYGNMASRSEAGWVCSILSDGNDPQGILFSAYNILPYTNVTGVVNADTTAGSTVTIIRKGTITGLSSLISGDSYYATGHGKIDNICPSNLTEGNGMTVFQPTIKRIGRASSTTELLVDM